MSSQMTFGKYIGIEIKDIFTKDPLYCQWLLNQPKVPKEIKDYIKSNLNDYYMPFGKYKNKGLKTIANQDPEYIKWLKNEPDIARNFKELSALLQKI